MKNIQSNKGVYVDPNAEAYMINILSSIFNYVAYFNRETIRYNMELASGIMSMEDRTMDSELFNYLTDHFCLIFYGILCNDTFRKAMYETVEAEISLDERSDKYIRLIRKGMKDENKIPNLSNETFILDFSKFNEDEFKNFSNRLIGSLDKLPAKYERLLDDFAYDIQMDEDKMLEIGFIFSNFTYLYRSLAKNELFASYIKTVLRSVKAELNIII